MNMTNKMIDATVNELVKELGKELMSRNQTEILMDYEYIKEVYNRVYNTQEDKFVICSYMSKAISSLYSKGMIDINGYGCVYYLSSEALKRYEYSDCNNAVHYADTIILDSSNINDIEVVVILGNIFDEYIEQLLIE